MFSESEIISCQWERQNHPTGTGDSEQHRKGTRVEAVAPAVGMMPE